MERTAARRTERRYRSTLISIAGLLVPAVVAGLILWHAAPSLRRSLSVDILPHSEAFLTYLAKRDQSDRVALPALQALWDPDSIRIVANTSSSAAVRGAANRLLTDPSYLSRLVLNRESSMDSRLAALALVHDHLTLSQLFSNTRNRIIQQEIIKRSTSPSALLNLLEIAKTQGLASDSSLSDFGNLFDIMSQINDEQTMLDALHILQPIVQNPVRIGGLLFDLRNGTSTTDHIIDVIDSPSALWAIAARNQNTILQERAIIKLEKIVGPNVRVEGVTLGPFGHRKTLQTLNEAGSIEYDQMMDIKMAMYHPFIRRFHKELRFVAEEREIRLNWSITGSVSCIGTTHDLEVTVYDDVGILFHQIFEGERKESPIPEGVTQFAPLIIAKSYCIPTYPSLDVNRICAALVELLPQTDLAKLANEPEECLRQAARKALGKG
jgi:hypothetical protein